MQEIIEKIALGVEKGKISKASPYPPEMAGEDGAEEIAAEALRNGIAPDSLMTGCMLGMERIGKDFEEELVFIPNLVLAAEAMNAVMKHLKPFLDSGQVKQKGTFVIGTVAGDLHDIGKNLVAMVIRGSGYKIVDLGVDVSTEKFLEAIKEHPGCFIGMSALLTTTMENMEKSVKAIKEASPETKVLIGGAPVSESFRARCGADFYSPIAQQAVTFLNENLP
ncbi:MAG: cobalamin-dependent protein [Fidelibacterota bacterium]|nr:MAG: cobalamin-dependent protein [Candidatus Neomarinimicrobiota bacterium]